MTNNGVREAVGSRRAVRHFLSSPIVGRRIRQHREMRGLTQIETGAELGVTGTAVSYWESGSRCPGIDQVLHMALLFGVDVAALLPSPGEFTQLLDGHDPNSASQ